MKRIVEAIKNLKKGSHICVTEYPLEVVQENISESYPGGKPQTGMDPRHYAPHGYSTYKFSNPDKASEFVHTWTNSGGIAVIGVDPENLELSGRDANTFVVYASPLNNFYGKPDTPSIQTPPQSAFEGTLHDFLGNKR